MLKRGISATSVILILWSATDFHNVQHTRKHLQNIFGLNSRICDIFHYGKMKISIIFNINSLIRHNNNCIITFVKLST